MSKNNNDSLGTFSEWRMRRLAPLALIIYIFALLFLICHFIFSGSEKISETSINLEAPTFLTLDISKSGLYSFKVKQVLNRIKVPNYSELDIEILDANYGHVYSFYKNLWAEKHPNENGGSSIYADATMDFELNFKTSGTYYLRAVSLNNNMGNVKAEYHKKTSGSLFYSTFRFIFCGLAILLFLGTPFWGPPNMMLASLSKVKSLKNNDLFWWVAIFTTILFITILISNLTYNGYPSAGEYNRLPGYFFDKKDVLYIG